jgi:hypothetical protein
MREICTEIEINASAERVWEVLTAFDAFPQWNPFIRKASGELKEGARLEVFIQPPGGKGMTFRPVVLRMQPPRELRWRGRLAIPGLFAGEHIFTIEPVKQDQVRFIHREEFRGMLVPLLWRSLDRDTRRGFLEMNQTLKDRAEGSGASIME